MSILINLTKNINFQYYFSLNFIWNLDLINKLYIRFIQKYLL